MSADEPAPRPLLRAVLTHPDGLPWFARARLSTRLAMLATTCCGLLATWQFSGPDDARIVPFVRELTWREGTAQSVAPESVDAMLRGLLGDERQLYTIPPAQFTLIQVLIARAIVFGNEIAPRQVDELLGRAESMAGGLDLNAATAPAAVPPRAPRRSHAAALWSGLAAAVAVIVLVTGLATPGWMRTHGPTTALAGVVQKLIDAQNSGDVDAADALSCRRFSAAEIQSQKREARRGDNGHAVRDGDAEISKDTATQRIIVTDKSGESQTVIVRLKRNAGTWCVAGLGEAPSDPNPSSGPSSSGESSSGPPSAGPTSPTAPLNPTGADFASAAAKFLSLINGRKLAAAESMVCAHPASAARQHVQGVVTGRIGARLAPGHPPTGSGIARIYTLQSDPGGGAGNLAMIAQDQRICVYDFNLATG